MAIIPVDNAHALQALQNDAQQMLGFIQWAKKRYQAYNQNLSTVAQMNAANITVTADQNTVTAFIGDLNRIIQVSSGIATTSVDMVFDAQAILGVL